ncbi:hypothetical protein ABHI18_005859 [Aspergillus niger]
MPHVVGSEEDPKLGIEETKYFLQQGGQQYNLLLHEGTDGKWLWSLDYAERASIELLPMSPSLSPTNEPTPE